MFTQESVVFRDANKYPTVMRKYYGIMNSGNDTMIIGKVFDKVTAMFENMKKLFCFSSPLPFCFGLQEVNECSKGGLLLYVTDDGLMYRVSVDAKMKSYAENHFEYLVKNVRTLISFIWCVKGKLKDDEQYRAYREVVNFIIGMFDLPAGHFEKVMQEL